MSSLLYLHVLVELDACAESPHMHKVVYACDCSLICKRSVHLVALEKFWMKALEDFTCDMGWQYDTRSNKRNVMTTQNVHDSHYYSV